VAKERKVNEGRMTRRSRGEERRENKLKTKWLRGR